MKTPKNVFSISFFTFLVFFYVFNTLRLYPTTNLTCTDVILPFKVTILILLACLLLYIGMGSLLSGIGSALILSGSIFIILESSVNSCVKDYWSFFGLFKFNICDLAITIGVVLVLFDQLVNKRKSVVYNDLVDGFERSKRK